MVDHVGGVGPLGGASDKMRVRKTTRQEVQPKDSVQVSAELQRLSAIPGIRLDKVMATRKAIAEGTYETPEKLDAALDAAIDDANDKV